MTVNRELLAALRNVITAAADPTAHASLVDLTLVQLAADDMEAAVLAREIWTGRTAEPTDAEVAEAADAAEMHLNY